MIVLRGTTPVAQCKGWSSVPVCHVVLSARRSDNIVAFSGSSGMEQQLRYFSQALLFLINDVVVCFITGGISLT